MTALAPEFLNLRKLNLGSGHDYRDGYINVDLYERHNPDLIADITELAMLPSGGYDEIIAQDVLEHLERNKVSAALAEWSRLMAEGGTLRIRVPSLVHMVLALCHPDNKSIEKADEINHMIFGTQAYSGDYHLTGFNTVILEARLAECGLKVCEATLLYGLVYEVLCRKCEKLTDYEEIVHNLYFKHLRRPADPEGCAYYMKQLQEGKIDIDKFESIIIESSEYKFINKNPSYLYGYIK
jgi:hypothetical protein